MPVTTPSNSTIFKASVLSPLSTIAMLTSIIFSTPVYAEINVHVEKCSLHKGYSLPKGFVFDKECYRLKDAPDFMMTYQMDNTLNPLSDRYYGYVNRKGKFVIKPKYKSSVRDWYSSEAFPYFNSNGIAIVKKGEKYSHEGQKQGLIDKTGKLIIPLEYDEISDWDVYLNSDSIQITKNGKIGYLNPHGELLIPAVYDEVGLFNTLATKTFEVYDTEEEGDKAFAKANAMIANKYNIPIANPKDYQKTKNKRQEIAFAKLEGRWGVIDNIGTIIRPFNFDYDSTSQIVEGTTTVTRESKYGRIDLNNKVIIPLEYDYIHSFQDGVTMIRKMDSGEGLINVAGDILIPPKYDRVWFDSKYVKAELTDKEGLFYRDTGKPLFPVEYQLINRVRDHSFKSNRPELFMVKKNDKKALYGLFNGKLEQYVDFGVYNRYESPMDDDRLEVSNLFPNPNSDKKEDEQKRSGFLNPYGDEIIPLKYAVITDFSDERAIVQDLTNGSDDDLLIDTNGKIIKNMGNDYDRVKEFVFNYASVKKDGKCGMIDKMGNLVVPFEYEETKAKIEDDDYTYNEKGEAIVPLYKNTVLYGLKDGKTVKLKVIPRYMWATRDGLIQ